METPAAYTARLRSYVGSDDPMSILRTTAPTLASLVADRDAAALRAQPAPGKWSVGQILAHLGDAEYVVGYRIRSILGENGVAIAGYDQSAWAVAMRYEAVAPEWALRRFREVRAINLGLLDTLRSEEWERYGVHSERGRETIRDIVALDAGHDINHVNQVRAILA